MKEYPSIPRTIIEGLPVIGFNKIDGSVASSKLVPTAQEFKREAWDHNLALAELRDALSPPDGSLFSYSTVTTEERIGQKT